MRVGMSGADHEMLLNSSSGLFRPGGSWIDAIRADDAGGRQLRNFLLFVLLFCVTHATVDAILAFSTAELGYELGSEGSFVLYLLYTLSALFLAKPIVARLGARDGVLFGLCGMICYVVAFFIALLSTDVATKEGVWIFGAALGGIGAGVLWTAQGAYFSLNAKAYAHATVNSVQNRDIETVSENNDSSLAARSVDEETSPKDSEGAAGAGGGSNSIRSSDSVSRSDNNGGDKNEKESAESTALYWFAAIFSAGYLLLETITKLFATAVYLADHKDQSWKGFVFGMYVIASVVSVIFYALRVRSYSSSEDARSTTRSEDLWARLKEDTVSVIGAMAYDRKLQLLLPYQVCFGFSASMVNAFIFSQIVSRHIGDGYVGFLSALTTLTAVATSYPYNYIANHYQHGKYWIIHGGSVSFLLTGLALYMNTDTLASWATLVFYFMIHGFARGAWENTNKAMIAEYFGEKSTSATVPASLGNDGISRKEGESQQEQGQGRRFTVTTTQSAYASVYFMSGLSAAIGFASYSSMKQHQIAVLNIFMPIFAALCFDASYRMHKAQVTVLEMTGMSNEGGSSSTNRG